MHNLVKHLIIKIRGQIVFYDLMRNRNVDTHFTFLFTQCNVLCQKVLHTSHARQHGVLFAVHSNALAGQVSVACSVSLLAFEGSIPGSGTLFKQLPVNSERMNTEYWLTVYVKGLPRKSG